MAGAQLNHIPIFIIAEEDKFHELGENDEYKITYGQESTIFEDYDFIEWADLLHVSTKNIGYDMCKILKGVSVITEEKEIPCEDHNIKINEIEQ